MQGKAHYWEWNPHIPYVQCTTIKRMVQLFSSSCGMDEKNIKLQRQRACFQLQTLTAQDVKRFLQDGPFQTRTEEINKNMIHFLQQSGCEPKHEQLSLSLRSVNLIFHWIITSFKIRGRLGVSDTLRDLQRGRGEAWEELSVRTHGQSVPASFGGILSNQKD